MALGRVYFAPLTAEECTIDSSDKLSNF